MDTELGERFARTLAAQDADGLKVLLTPHVDFRAMTPGGFAESHDADVVVDEVMLGSVVHAGPIDHRRPRHRLRSGRPGRPCRLPLPRRAA